MKGAGMTLLVAVALILVGSLALYIGATGQAATIGLKL
jgi:hypothetical protein